MHCLAQTPITGLQCCGTWLGRSCSHSSACQQPGPPQLLVASDLTLSHVTDLHYWIHLQLAPPAVCLHTPNLTLNPKPLLHAPTARHNSPGCAHCQCTHSWPWPLQFTLAPTATHVSGTGPWQFTCTCSWPPQVSIYTTPALATTAPCLVP